MAVTAFSGIVPRERAQRVAGRRWRRICGRGGAFERYPPLTRYLINSYNYQTGSFDAEAAQVAQDVSVAASHFLLNQLPELYTASERSESNFPVQYLGANVPQAWAAGSVFHAHPALLGFLPDAPRNKLYVDPFLPAWLPDLTVWSSAATLRPRSSSSGLARCDSAPQAPALLARAVGPPLSRTLSRSPN
jgi:hypothetical protein